jgi:hypothetical protein
MAHPTPQELDTLAAAAAASATAAATEEASAVDYGDQTVLAYGATGEKVARLVNLLASAGHATNHVIKGGPPVLDLSVLADVEAFQIEAGLHPGEGELATAEIPAGVEGQLVEALTWQALYEKAAALAAPGQEAPAGG